MTPQTSYILDFEKVIHISPLEKTFWLPISLSQSKIHGLYPAFMSSRERTNTDDTIVIMILKLLQVLQWNSSLKYNISFSKIIS
ncbi:hypothetical protein IAQ61_010814 [Plenodomus lingam]|uniref:uncharacterized protein n=1 Tax=Leptosphaeria maculans TaxID=5022 RepID=UPI003329F044|nr:hypothetical protein IAQ61_010814 [Plenodomus lingam]